jgi:hypothetical protein
MPASMQDPQFPSPPPPLQDRYTVRFDPPPPPPPPGSCNVGQAIKNKCAQLGGWWDDESCSCQY